MVICRVDVDPTRPTDHGSLLHQSGFLYTLVSFMGTLSIISACTHVYVSVKDDSDPRLEELIGIIHLWDSAYFLSIVSKTMAEELIRVRR